MNIITYHSTNAKPHEAWLAYVELENGQQWLVRCTGHSELEAKTKAQVLWDNEQKKYKLSNTAAAIKANVQSPYFPKKVQDGRGVAFAGKVWVINRSTHHLCRIDPSQLAEFEAKGYVRGGPRSK